MPREQLIFLHVPKTAGTTLRAIAYAHMRTIESPPYTLARHATLTPQGSRPWIRSPRQDRSHHWAYRVWFSSLPDRFRGCRYATMLRDPIRRCVSLYNHLGNAQFNGKPPSMREIVNMPGIGMQFTNHQVRIVSGRKASHGETRRSTLDAAIANIESDFSFVGITEEFEPSMLLAESTLGWHRVPYVSRNLGSQMKRDFASTLTRDGKDNDIEFLREKNALDFELYAFAKKRLLDSLGGRIEADWQVLVSKRVGGDAAQEVPIRSEDAVGSLEVPRRNKVIGWARIRRSDATARVKIRINDRDEYTVLADRTRSDLEKTKVDLCGSCGLSLCFQRTRACMPVTQFAHGFSIRDMSCALALDSSMGKSTRHVLHSWVAHLLADDAEPLKLATLPRHLRSSRSKSNS